MSALSQMGAKMVHGYTMGNVNGVSSRNMMKTLRKPESQSLFLSDDDQLTAISHSSVPNNAAVDSDGCFELQEPSRGIGSNVENAPSLVLNADYTPLSHLPLSLWHWQDSLRAIFSDKAVVVSEYNIVIRSVSCSFKIPSVIALKDYRRKPNTSPQLTRQTVFIRDNYCCQYCMKKFQRNQLSLDHVIPRSKGGRLSWTNTVTACLQCNYKKGDKLPEELSKIGMKLRTMPYAPLASEIQYKARNAKRTNLHNYHRDWLDFL